MMHVLTNPKACIPSVPLWCELWQLHPALKFSSTPNAHSHCGSSALFWARASLPGQHFHPNAPYPSFPAGLTRTQHSDECGQHGADPPDRGWQASRSARDVVRGPAPLVHHWPHHGKVSDISYCFLACGWTISLQDGFPEIVQIQLSFLSMYHGWSWSWSTS
jgi:hypothetical protein